MREIKYIVLHCSATRADQDVDVEWARKIHVERRGWRDVGYHFFIKRDGTIQEGRPVSQSGAHVSGHNYNSIGICYAGGLDKNHEAEDNRTPEQLKAMGELVDSLMMEYSGAEVLGHRDFEGVRKSCPCFDAKEWYNEREAKKYTSGRMAKTRSSRDTGCGR